MLISNIAPIAQADTCPPRSRRAERGVAGAGAVAIMYYTYVLLSSKDSKYYIGYTHDLVNRIHEHVSGQVAATQNRLPVKLIYYEACLSKEKALQRENYFKSGFGRRFLKSRV